LIKEFLYQNKKIVYRCTGKGKAVMLVHGFGETGDVWKQQEEFLQSNFYLIIPDLPGSGKSEMIDDMSMEGIAEVLHSIIHEENIGRCTIIGHSMGGYITLALVENYWNHVNAFGLFHSTAYADTEEKKLTRKKGIEFIKQHGAFEFLKTTSPNLFSPTTQSDHPGLVSSFIKTLESFNREALIAYSEAMIQRPDRTHLLKTTANPVLFIAGQYDNAVPLTDLLKQCHLPEKSYFHHFNKSGHMGMIEQPLQANQALKDFLLENEN
jgi:pimeloyl-ACP methyl ester carboxylesterase